MPRVTQYIRDEDFEVWKAIKNKSEFIHNALTGMSIRFSEDVEQVDLVDVKLHKKPPKVIKTKQDAAKAVKEVFPDAKPIPPVIYKNTSNWGA